MNNLISWVKRTICCLLSGRESAQKARHGRKLGEDLSRTRREMGRARSGDLRRDSLERHSPNPGGKHRDLRAPLHGRRRPKEGREAEESSSRASSRTPRSRSPGRARGCAGSSPARMSWAAWGAAGNCLPLSLVYFGHCSAKSPLGRAWGGWLRAAAARQPGPGQRQELAVGTELIRRGFAPLSPSPAISSR